MPLIRKIVPCGKTSKGVILPKSWLELIERETGKSVKEVSVEVDGEIIIRPIISGTKSTINDKVVDSRGSAPNA